MTRYNYTVMKCYLDIELYIYISRLQNSLQNWHATESDTERFNTWTIPLMCDKNPENNKVASLWLLGNALIFEDLDQF